MKRHLSWVLAGIVALVALSGCSVSPQTVETQTKTTQTKATPSDTVRTVHISEDITEGGKYRLIEVDGGDLSGEREANVVVDIGFGDREYWAYTNANGQLVRVVAKEVTLQNDKKEKVNKKGRYFDDEAKVPGTEKKNLDEGHVLADSLGGVSNAYNITPQDSVLNRHGDQAYMEKTIREAGGCTDFEAIITYPNTETQIPSHYEYVYTLNFKDKSYQVVDAFDNVNPDKTVKNTAKSDVNKKLSDIDTNGDGQVTIKEAKAAGFKMPIKKGHWLYEYMDDRDGDGQVGE